MDGIAESGRNGSASPRPPLRDDDDDDGSSRQPLFRRTRSRSRSISPEGRGRYNSRSRSRSRSLSDASMSSRTRSPHRRSSSPQHPSSSTHIKNDHSKVALRIDYLTRNVRESHLRHIFNWYGQVQSVHLTPSSRHSGVQRDGWAWVIMSSVGEAAKAALYMSGGQIDGASIAIKTCEVPADLPPERPRDSARQRSDRISGSRRTEWDDRAERERKYNRDDGDDASRGGSRIPRDSAYTTGVHPDRQRRLNDSARSDRDRFSNRFDDDRDRTSRHPKPMRKWGAPSDPSPPLTRRTETPPPRRSRSPQRSPQHGRRRSSASVRASPSY